MAWQPVLPNDPVVASWWRRAGEREEAERRAAAADRALRAAALAARVRKAIRDLDAALARSARPAVARRHADPVAGYRGGARPVGAIEHGPPGRILGVR
jgi:hypothetical protein